MADISIGLIALASGLAIGLSAIAAAIAEKEIGSGGFGYDPIFFIPQLNKTVAQLSPAEKNSISHRASAIRKLKPLLAELLSSNTRSA